MTAGVARALGEDADEGLEVWIAAGGLVFVVSALAALVGASPPVVWSVLLLVAMLASRFVPMLAIDVPDHHLIDLDRLAVSAWSAREEPRGRRGRTVVSARGVAEVARRGARITTAAAVAIAATTCLSAALLLEVVPDDIDRIGARCMVFFVGASLLLVARSYRHVGARALLRLGGLFCWVVLGRDLLDALAPERLALVAGAAGLLALVMVVAAVATGRGWRSAWWSRRAEIAESLLGRGGARVARRLLRVLPDALGAHLGQRALHVAFPHRPSRAPAPVDSGNRQVWPVRSRVHDWVSGRRDRQPDERSEAKTERTNDNLGEVRPGAKEERAS